MRILHNTSFRTESKLSCSLQTADVQLHCIHILSQVSGKFLYFSVYYIIFPNTHIKLKQQYLFVIFSLLIIRGYVIMSLKVYVNITIWNCRQKY